VSGNRIALLRGINIGSRQRVSMPELRSVLEELGYGNVRTLVQSGNVVFTSRAAPATLEGKLEREIEARLGVDPKVVVRTRDELAAAIEANPFPVPANPKNLHVTFLSGEPDAEAVKKLEAADLGDDRVAFAGREIYVLYANGMGRSELAKQLGRAKLGVAATDRNWNTVTKLLEMAWIVRAATTPPIAPNRWPCHEIPGVGTRPNISVVP
jgi:uncharacterized protein (DUF1697 family)